MRAITQLTGKSRLVFLLALISCIARPVVAQQQAQQLDGPTPEQQEMFQQMQQARDQMFQRMQDRGIDPAEFFAQMRDQMASGSFDPADLQKQLVDKGLIDQDLVDRMQTTMQRVTVGTLKQRLNASDDDWKVIEPKLQKVVALRGVTGQAGGFNPMMRMMTGAAQSSAAADVSKAMRELRETVKDTNAKAETIAAKLNAWREARDTAKSELAKAQADLVGVLTTRQEGVLLGLGLIQ